nr:hypothetical protein [uncultured Shinella sp.]
MVLISLFVPASEDAGEAICFSLERKLASQPSWMFSPLDGNFKRKDGRPKYRHIYQQKRKKGLAALSFSGERFTRGA